MPRPRKFRKIRGNYEILYYKPRGVRLSELECIDLKLDETEAIRLVDYQRLSMDEAAKEMHISKPTLCRLANSGRSKLAEAICLGKAISIQDPESLYSLTNTTMPNFDGTGPDGEGPQTGRGMGNCKGAQEKTPMQRPRRGQAARTGMGRNRRRQ